MPVATIVAVTVATSCVPPADDCAGGWPTTRTVANANGTAITDASVKNLRMTPPVGSLWTAEGRLDLSGCRDQRGRIRRRNLVGRQRSLDIADEDVQHAARGCWIARLQRNGRDAEIGLELDPEPRRQIHAVDQQLKFVKQRRG